MSGLISNGMILERNAKIYGLEPTLSSVEVSFLDKIYEVPVKKGEWTLHLENLPYGGPYEMKIGEKVLTDIYVGIVFLCSGQSNMELPISEVRIKYAQELANVLKSNVHYFNVQPSYDFGNETTNIDGEWVKLNKDTIDECYALSYFFAQKLNDFLDIPIGLINCAVGGSNIEAWLSFEVAKENNIDLNIINQYLTKDAIDQLAKKELDHIIKWHQETDTLDIGLRNNYQGNDSNFKLWPKRRLTSKWNDDIGINNGVVWFKAVVNVEKRFLNKSAKILLGTPTDADDTYVNGKLVGSTEYHYPNRIYDIDPTLLKEGENIITIRLRSHKGYGGFTEGKEYKLLFEDQSEINLPSHWYYKIGCTTKPMSFPTKLFTFPTGLYNGMLKHCLKYTCNAMLWYQGETNTLNPHNYDKLLVAFLKQIRESLSDNCIFLSVQLPNFESDDLEAWQVLRNKQKAILDFKRTALVNTIGLGEDNDLHPLNIQDIGYSLADAYLSIEHSKITNNQRLMFSKQ